MATYNTYQEAKIANPESEIFVLSRKTDLMKGWFQAINDAPTSQFANGWTKCNPADYCMTVEKFLADGNKFVDGDLIYSSPLSKVIVVSNVGEFGASYPTDGANNLMLSDNVRYILRAVALEFKQETPLLQTSEDFEHSKTLNFIRDRLVGVHGEPKNLDYMHKLNNAIAFVERMEESSKLCGSSTGKEEKPKRTKVSYEKLRFECAWHAVKAFEDGEKLYTKQSSEEFALIDNAPDVLRYLYGLYERIETEITEREEFIEVGVKELDLIKNNSIAKNMLGKIFDSGKFKLVD